MAKYIMNIEKKLDLDIDMDCEIISKLHSKITQKNIINTVQDLKRQLINYDFDKEKILDIYDISIELLQNILKYSYGTKLDENKKREADGIFCVSYNSIDKNVIINSCNIINDKQYQIIKKRLLEIENLDKQELRKLLRHKMKLRKDGHKYGAGLGFATIATKIAKPIDVVFEPILENIFKYSFMVTI